MSLSPYLSHVPCPLQTVTTITVYVAVIAYLSRQHVALGFAWRAILFIRNFENWQTNCVLRSACEPLRGFQAAFTICFLALPVPICLVFTILGALRLMDVL